MIKFLGYALDVGILLVILSLLLYLAFRIYDTSYFKGKARRKKRLRSFLKKCSLSGDKQIDNLYLINPNNQMTVQIDHLLISTRGIFVIETKNLSGTIYGSDKRREWIQTFGYGNSTYTFYSPVKQNYTHICTLKDLFHPAVRVNNVVIFAQNNTARIKSESVYSLSAFKKFLNEQPQTLLTERARDELYTEILRYRNGCKISVRKHVKNIRAMQKDMKKNICPRCKGRLVLRNGPYGEFYGCERFPKCNFTKQLDD